MEGRGKEKQAEHRGFGGGETTLWDTVTGDTCRDLFVQTHRIHKGFPGGSDGEESACHAGDPDSIPGLGRSPGEGNGNPLQYSRLENSMDRGAWWATAYRVAKSLT